MSVMYDAAAVAIGLCIGSFFNVLIYRIPRNESIVFPGSHCPVCNRTIQPFENIPLFSFLFLRGRCAGCKSRISWTYPAVELLTAIATYSVWVILIKQTLIVRQPVDIITALFGAITLLILIPIALIDLKHLIIPDSLSLPFLGLAIGLCFLPGGITPLQSLFGILGGGGSLLLAGKLGELALKRGEAMGGGDIKLMAMFGAVWGWELSLLCIGMASLLGAITGGLMMLKRVWSNDKPIPFGPFLAVAGWVCALFGHRMIDAYIKWSTDLFF